MVFLSTLNFNSHYLPSYPTLLQQWNLPVDIRYRHGGFINKSLQPSASIVAHYSLCWAWVRQIFPISCSIISFLWVMCWLIHMDLFEACQTNPSFFLHLSFFFGHQQLDTPMGTELFRRIIIHPPSSPPPSLPLFPHQQPLISCARRELWQPCAKREAMWERQSTQNFLTSFILQHLKLLPLQFP